MFKRDCYLLLIFFLFVSVAFANKTDFVSLQRQQFLQAEQAIKLNDATTYLRLAEGLKSYPLYPYLQYQWLAKHLDDREAIQKFLLQHPRSRYASLLKNHWLKHLAKQKDWENLIRHYRSSSRADLQCAYYWAKYQSGYKKMALSAARKLWVKGKSQPAICNPLFKKLQASKFFTRELLWQRFQAALKNRRVSLAKYVKRLMNKQDAKAAALWLKVHQQPEKIIQTKNWHQGYKQAGLMFAHAIDRIARKNSRKAADIWFKENKDYVIPASRRRQIERRLALGLAFRGEEDAWEKLTRLKHKDLAVKEWMIRTALRQRDWRRVEKALSTLDEKEKNKINWRYWRARALEQNGQKPQAQKIYQSLAQDRSFYGFLAANHLQKSITVGDKPLLITDQEIEKFKNQPPFRLIEELIAIGRPEEAKRQWWYEVRRLKKADIMTAAKLAERWHWNQVAIYTIARAKYWDDVGLRFPIKYADAIMQNARENNLDPAIVLGLIRRESAFDEKARSPVGARGLMQIMPKTGKQIARSLKEKWRSETILYDPEVNVRFGSFYYKQLLNRFNGHYALAAAAYNAGPHRVIKWLPKMPMSADIWIETIPFKETRAYVGAVLTYALIYQQRMKRSVLKIKDFIRDVLPQ